MKHLKSFNEDITSLGFEEDLQEFCEMNLAYLLDEAELQVVPSPGGWHELHLIRILLNEPKRWNEIKDHMIPFLTRLVSKYEITDEVYKEVTLHKSKYNNNGDIRLYLSFEDDEYSTSSGRAYITNLVKNLIADNHVWPNARISDIRLYVKGYKTEKKSILTKIKSFFK